MRSKKACSMRMAVFAIFAAFSLALTIPAQSEAKTKFKVLHTFHGYPHRDGGFPSAHLILDSAGNLYGTTSGGGKKWPDGSWTGTGTAFKLDKNGKEVWLDRFNAVNGASPEAGLVRDPNGNLFGETFVGGSTDCNLSWGCGVLFRLDTHGKETVLYKFSGTPNGETPRSLLVEDKAGNLYGTTGTGGS